MLRQILSLFYGIGYRRRLVELSLLVVIAKLLLGQSILNPEFYCTIISTRGILERVVNILCQRDVRALPGKKGVGTHSS